MTFGERHYKLFGLVTNRDLPGDKLIWWARERLKGMRFGSINLAGRVVSRARQLIIRLSGGQSAYELLMVKLQ